VTVATSRIAEATIESAMKEIGGSAQVDGDARSGAHTEADGWTEGNSEVSLSGMDRHAGVALVLIASVLIVAKASARHTDTANPFQTAAARNAVIHFVPLDARAQQLLAATVPSVKRWFSSPTEVSAVPSAGPDWLNRGRRQMNGDRIMDDLLARFRRAQGNRPAFLLIVTSASMYSSVTPAYNFVFGLTAPPGQVGQVTNIIASAQMRVFHPEREKARLTKMMLRYLGEVMCHLPRNDNPRSVLYRTIVSDADLDRMVAKLPRGC
jgi:hypothetical protein